MAIFRTLIIAIALSVAAFLGAPEASAGDPQIDAAKSQGVVGERIDGYLGIVGSADASLRRKVQEVNAKRRALYDQLAGNTGTTTAQVARVTGEKQIAAAGRGEYIMDESGRWIQR